MALTRQRHQNKPKSHRRNTYIAGGAGCLLLSSSFLSYTKKRHLFHFLKTALLRGTWVAQSVERPTSAQVMIPRFMDLSPSIGLAAVIAESASDPLSPSLSAPPLPMLSLSQKWINIKKKTQLYWDVVNILYNPPVQRFLYIHRYVQPSPSSLIFNVYQSLSSLLTQHHVYDVNT